MKRRAALVDTILLLLTRPHSLKRMRLIYGQKRYDLPFLIFEGPLLSPRTLMGSMKIICFGGFVTFLNMGLLSIMLPLIAIHSFLQMSLSAWRGIITLLYTLRSILLSL